MAPALTLTADVLSPLEYSKMFSEFTPQFQNLKWDPQSTGEPVQIPKKNLVVSCQAGQGKLPVSTSRHNHVLEEKLRRQLQTQASGWLNVFDDIEVAVLGKKAHEGARNSEGGSSEG